MTDLRWPILQWTENLPPSQEYCDPIEERWYNHCAAYTPFGRFLVCWRTSKPHIFCIRETPWSAFAVETCDSLETAKAACQQAMNDRLEQWGCAFGQPAGLTRQADQLLDPVKAALINAIGGNAYDCTRVWNAWNVGTMQQDDFAPIIEDDERVTEIALAVLNGIGAIAAEREVEDKELLRAYALGKSGYCYEGPDDEWPLEVERAATVAGIRAAIASCRAPVSQAARPTTND